MCDNHVHPHEDTRRIVNRIARAAGHLTAISQMIEEGRDCSEVLIQLAAVRSAVNNIGKLIINDHMAHCITAAMENGDQDALRQFADAMNIYLK
ncbi:MAG: metal-sensing transcriptional repressor [Clostridia bacterium]|nr:metal-sensing transcriptional repressor [Clostridia bacterium]